MDRHQWYRRLCLVVAGSQTRRYHGLLVAALQPPVGCTELVSSIDEIVHYAEADYSLATHRWTSGGSIPKDFSSSKIFIWKAQHPFGLTLWPTLYSKNAFDAPGRKHHVHSIHPRSRKQRA
jgi:hypothetical protein